MIKDFPPHRSMGLESLSTKLVNDVAPAMSEILAHIINGGFETSDIPFEWKTARITPIYKEQKNMTPTVIDLFPSCNLYQRFLKKLYIKSYSDTLMIWT